MNASLRKNLELLVGICSGIAIAYSDVIPFVGGICVGILLECAHPGLCGSTYDCLGYVASSSIGKAHVASSNTTRKVEEYQDDNNTKKKANKNNFMLI